MDTWFKTSRICRAAAASLLALLFFAGPLHQIMAHGHFCSLHRDAAGYHQPRAAHTHDDASNCSGCFLGTQFHSTFVSLMTVRSGPMPLAIKTDPHRPHTRSVSWARSVRAPPPPI